MSAASCKAAVDSIVQTLSGWKIAYEAPGEVICVIGSSSHQTALWFIQTFILLFGAYGGLQLGLTALLDPITSLPIGSGEKAVRAQHELKWVNAWLGIPLTLGTVALCAVIFWKVGLGGVVAFALIAFIVITMTLYTAITSISQAGERPLDIEVTSTKRRGMAYLAISAVLLAIERALAMPILFG